MASINGIKPALHPDLITGIRIVFPASASITISKQGLNLCVFVNTPIAYQIEVIDKMSIDDMTW
jgi:hypothetical protein